MVLNKRIWRTFMEHKAQYIGSIVLILLGAYTFTMMNQFATNFARLVDEFQVDYVQEDATFTTESQISNIAELETDSGALIEEGLTLDYTLAEGQTLRLFTQNEKVNIPAITEGEALSKSGDILLGQYFATANKYEIGDQIELFNKRFTVVGFMALPNFMYPTQSESDMMPQPTFGTAVISKEDFAAFEQGNIFYAVKFNDNGENAFARALHFRELLSNNEVKVVKWSDIENNKRVSVVGAEVQIIGIVSKVVPTAILLLATVMVANVLWRMIKRESSVIGALYALGYKKWEIYRHYLAFPLIIALIGGIIGTIMGIFLVRFMLTFMLTVFIVPLTGIEWNPLIMIISPLIPIVLLGLSGYFVIWNELKHSPVELMRGKESENKVSFLERVVKLQGLSFGVKFATRQQLRSLSRLLFLLVGVIVATVLLLWAVFLTSSTEFLFRGILDVYNFKYEYAFPELRYEALPEGAEPFAADFFLPNATASEDFYVTGVMPDSTMLTLTDESGASLSTDQIIITKPLAELLGVNVGDTATIVRRLDGRTFSLHVDSVADSYAGNFIFMPLAVFNETFGRPEGSYNGSFSNVLLDIPDTESYSLVTLDEKIAGTQELIGTVGALVAFIGVMAFVIAVIVIYVVTTLIVEENKDIIALMKVFGYRKKEINALILNSSTIIVVIGYLIGIPLTILAVGALSQTMENAMGMNMPPATESLPLPYLVIGFVIVMLSYELSKWLCRKKVEAVSMSEALKLAME